MLNRLKEVCDKNEAKFNVELREDVANFLIIYYNNLLIGNNDKYDEIRINILLNKLIDSFNFSTSKSIDVEKMFRTICQYELIENKITFDEMNDLILNSKWKK